MAVQSLYCSLDFIIMMASIKIITFPCIMIKMAEHMLENLLCERRKIWEVCLTIFHHYP